MWLHDRVRMDVREVKKCKGFSEILKTYYVRNWGAIKHDPNPFDSLRVRQTSADTLVDVKRLIYEDERAFGLLDRKAFAAEGNLPSYLLPSS